VALGWWNVHICAIIRLEGKKGAEEDFSTPNEGTGGGKGVTEDTELPSFSFVLSLSNNTCYKEENSKEPKQVMLDLLCAQFQ